MLKPLLNLFVYLLVPLLAPILLFNVYLTFLADYFSEINISFIFLIILGGILVGIALSILAYENYVFRRKLLATLIMSCLSSLCLFVMLGFDFQDSIKLPITATYFLAFTMTTFLWNSKLTKINDENFPIKS